MSNQEKKILFELEEARTIALEKGLLLAAQKLQEFIDDIKRPKAYSFGPIRLGVKDL